VKYRVERLEKEAIIKGYFPMIDISRLGFTSFRLYLKFRNLVPEKKRDIFNYMEEHRSIWAVVAIAGKWDVALGVAVKDIYDFYNVWEAILQRYLEVIGDYAICIYSPIYHYSKSYMVQKDDESPIRILGGQGKAQFDNKDKLILVNLSKNARISLLELSRTVKMSPESVSYRIKQLEKKGIIQGYRAMIDVHKLGYEFYKAEIRLASYSQISSILTYCHMHPNIYQVDKTIGGETLEIEFHVKSLNNMLDIIADLEVKFPKIIEKFDYITVLSEEQTTYMPDLIQQ
ncbi:winged helix-turn-helix transcriptional regulator, partial [Candidatus Woesearchaeota archaeon]|nr:winged helix-turn-helix transcriptional regulator [Candidatus Woesearchaeota archaeon]